LYWDKSSRGRTKIYCTSTTSPTNQTTKEGPLSYVLQESPFGSVSTFNRGHPSLKRLVHRAKYFTNIYKFLEFTPARSK
jgi:hypothetical protein